MTALWGSPDESFQRNEKHKVCILKVGVALTTVEA